MTAQADARHNAHDDGTPSPAETSEMLRRILHAVEGEQRKRWVELTCAVVLALATMASAWCAYQSSLWGGVQTFKLAASAKAGREAAKYELEAADRSNQLSDSYVLLTVLFAAVLFFGRISGTISNDSRRLRWTMQVLSLMLFLGISLYLLTMPICRE